MPTLYTIVHVRPPLPRPKPALLTLLLLPHSLRCRQHLYAVRRAAIFAATSASDVSDWLYPKYKMEVHGRRTPDCCAGVTFGS